MLSIRPCRDAVGAAYVGIPECGAALTRAVQNAVRIEIEHGVFRRVNQTDDIKERAQTLYIIGDRQLVPLRFCPVQRKGAQLYCTFCVSVRQPITPT